MNKKEKWHHTPEGRARLKEYERTHWRERQASRERRIERNRQTVRDHLAAHPCADCGEDNSIVLQFDSGEKKQFALGRLVIKGVGPLAEALAEAEVRCANCLTKKYPNKTIW